MLLPLMEMVMLPGKEREEKEEKEEGKVKRGRIQERQRKIAGMPEGRRERQ